MGKPRRIDPKRIKLVERLDKLSAMMERLDDRLARLMKRWCKQRQLCRAAARRLARYDETPPPPQLPFAPPPA